MVGRESLVSYREDTFIFVGSSIGGNWLVLSLASSSGRNLGWSVSLISVGGISDIWGGVSISSYISSSIALEWGTMLSVDTVNSGVGESLRLNSGDSVNDDSCNILIRTCVLSSAAKRCGMIVVDSRDSP